MPKENVLVKTLLAQFEPRTSSYENLSTKSFAKSLEIVKINARKEMLDLTFGSKEKGLRFERLGRYFEHCLKANRFPGAIVSEDVSGRFMAEVCRSFLAKLRVRLKQEPLNVPIISYPVGRGTYPEEATQSAKGVQELITKDHAAEPILVVTDILENGTSALPLLTEIVGKSRPVTLFVTKAMTAASRELLRPFGTHKDFSILETHSTIDLGRRPEVRTIKREGDAIVPASIENNPIRREAVEVLSDVFLNAFLERPGVKAYVETLETSKAGY